MNMKKEEDCVLLTRTWRVLQRWRCKSSLPVPTLAARGEVGIYPKVTNMCNKAIQRNQQDLSLVCKKLSCYQAQLLRGGEGGGGGKGKVYRKK